VPNWKPNGHSAITMLLPYLDLQPLYDKWDFNAQYCCQWSTAPPRIPVFLCPSDLMPAIEYCLNNYCLSSGPNVGWTLDPTEAIGISHPVVSHSLRDVRDGTGNTILMAEIVKGTGIDGGPFDVGNIIRGISLPPGYPRIKPTRADLA